MMDKFVNGNGLEKIENDKIVLVAGARTDYFNVFDNEKNEIKRTATAPFMYQDVKGDFIVSVKVSVDFRDTYDSAVIMIMQDDDMWAKVCYELTDFGKKAVVSVVTNKTSDDANGNNVDVESLYLKAVRVNDDFSFHYSLDGENYEMVRLFHLEVNETVKVGIVAQSPKGEGTECIFEEYRLINTTAEDIRKGK